MDEAAAAAELPVFDEATESLVRAAMATTAARAARRGYRESVESLVSAAMVLSGFSFAPSDEELLECFLQKKVRNEAMMPVAGMRETNVGLHNPFTLAATLPKAGDRREWYFFTPRNRKYPGGVRPDRRTDGGFWKATGADKEVIGMEGETIGFKRSLVFYLGEHELGRHEKTNWIMYEYRLNQPPRNRESEDDMRLDDWVLCSIHDQPQSQARRAKRKRRVVDHVDVEPVVEQEQLAIAALRHQHDQCLEQQQQQPLQQYAQQPSTRVEGEQYGYQHQYLEQQQQPLPTLDVVEQQQYYAYHLQNTTLDVPVIEQEQQYQHQYLEQQPLINNNASSVARAEAEYYYRYQQDLEQLPSLHVPDNRVAEQEHYANLELQPNTRVEAEQYRYEHDQYLQQQQQMPTLDVVEQEQYAYHLPLPTTLHVPVIEQEQYACVEAREQYRYQQDQYLQQQQLPNLDVVEQEQYAYDLPLPTTLDVPVIDQQEQYAQQPSTEQNRRYQHEYLEQHLQPMLKPDNSIPQASGGFGFEWVDDFFDFSEFIDDNYIYDQGQDTTSISSTPYSEEASKQNHSGLCQHQHQGY